MDELVQSMIGAGTLKTPRIIEAFKAIDRKNFILRDYESLAYTDDPQHIGFAQTISQPSTVAFMLELLDPRPGQKILDIGSGSGWTTALLAHIVGNKGKVYGKEIIPQLVQFGNSNLKPYTFENASITPATPQELGDTAHAPYDRILVSASAKEFPEPLMEQLIVGGILVMPVNYDIIKVTKVTPAQVTKEVFPGYVFVPLV